MDIDFARIPREQLESMLEAGLYVIECHRVLVKTGDTIVGELLKTEEEFFEWEHYPDDDIRDEESHSQFFYHAHSLDDRTGEHGHFHTFLRKEGMPEDIIPADVPKPEDEEPEYDDLSHLICISMNNRSLPQKLFTVNRWVTGETWYRAEDVIRMLDRFEIDHAQPSWPVNIWITCMIRLFRPQIESLIQKRDAAIAEWQKAHPGEIVYESRAEEIEVPSICDIDIDRQVAAIQTALEK